MNWIFWSMTFSLPLIVYYTKPHAWSYFFHRDQHRHLKAKKQACITWWGCWVLKWIKGIHSCKISLTCLTHDICCPGASMLDSCPWWSWKVVAAFVWTASVQQACGRQDQKFQTLWSSTYFPLLPVPPFSPWTLNVKAAPRLLRRTWEVLGLQFSQPSPTSACSKATLKDARIKIV